jgi:hypothetical protein
VRSLAKRWEDAHVPAVIKPGRYEAVVADLETALDGAGLRVDRTRAPRMLSVPPRLLGAVGGPAVKGLVPDELVLLQRDGLEVLVYPSDIAMLGSKELIARSRAAIARRLTFTEAYLTTAKESQQIEDRLTEISRRRRAHPAEFAPLDEELGSLIVPYDEWETLYRLRLQVENEVRLPDASVPAGFSGSGTERPGAASRAPRSGERRTGSVRARRLEWAAALSVVALFILDVAFMIRDGHRSNGRTR